MTMKMKMIRKSSLLNEDQSGKAQGNLLQVYLMVFFLKFAYSATLINTFKSPELAKS